MPSSRETTTEILNARQSVVHAYIHVPVGDKIGFQKHVTETLNTRQLIAHVCVQPGFPSDKTVDSRNMRRKF